MKTLKNSFLVNIIFCLQPDLPPSPADTYLLSEARYQRPPLPTDIFNLVQNFHDLAENYQKCVAELVQSKKEIEQFGVMQESNLSQLELNKEETNELKKEFEKLKNDTEQMKRQEMINYENINYNKEKVEESTDDRQELKDKIKELNKEINQLQTQESSISENLESKFEKKLEEILAEKNENMARMERQMKDIKQELLDEKSKSKIYFQYGLSKHKFEKNWSKILFDVDLGSGNHTYDPSTGDFIAEHEGLYFFLCGFLRLAWGEVKEQDTVVDFYVNDEHNFAAAYSQTLENFTWGSSATLSIVRYLNRGDRVYLKMQGSLHYGLKTNPKTYFLGYRVN